MSRAKAYAELFKLKQTALLVYSGIFGYFIAAGLDINIVDLSLFIIASFLSICGTTGLNMYYDRDIDSVMFRTRNRPLPSNRLDPDEAFAVSMTLAATGIAIGFFINYWVGIAITLGFLIDVYVYTVFLKRRTPLNIVIGAIAGGMPIFGGYMVYTKQPTLKALLLLLIIAIWAILHIWFIATYYIEDYQRANIPMLPVVIGEEKTIKVSFAGLAILLAIVIAMKILNYATWFSVSVSLLFTIILAIILIKYLQTNNKEYVRKAYKILSPYQGILLLVFFIEKILGFV